MEGFYRYPQRRRLCGDIIQEPPYESSAKITDLPTEMIQMIFSWLPCGFLASKVKLVSRMFKYNVNEILFRKFLQLSICFDKLNKMACDFIKQQEIKPHKFVFQILHCIEVVRQEYKMLEATILRYLYQCHVDFVYCHTFGYILDLFYIMYFRLYNKRGKFSPSSRNEVLMKKLINVIKKFTFNFELNVELQINEDCYVSGAKICDILDSCAYATREIQEEKYEDGVCNLKIRYEIERSWFIVMPADAGSVSSFKSWQDHQRLMYLRLRRLLCTHPGQITNSLFREVLAMAEVLRLMRAPRDPSYVYNGYGEVDGEIFFYGSFNKGGYNIKVRKMEEREPDPEEYALFKLEIILELSCGLAQAPLQIIKQKCFDVERKPAFFIMRRSSRLHKDNFNMKIQFNSLQPGTYLPKKYVFEVSEEKRLKIVDKLAQQIK